MLRLAVIVVGLAGATSALADGKVVRVERVRVTPLIVPVLCVNVRPSGEGMCIGPQPKRGDSVILLDETQVIAELKIDDAKRLQPACDAVWTVTSSVVRGDVSAASSRSIGLIDASASPRSSRLLPKQKLPKPTPQMGRVELGIDRDSDEKADVLVTGGSCTNAPGECLEFWSRRSNGLEKVWSADLQPCR